MLDKLGLSSNAEVVNGVPGVGSDSAGDQSQIDAFTEAPELGARYDDTIHSVHAGEQAGGKKKRKRTKKRSNLRKKKRSSTRGKKRRKNTTRAKKRGNTHRKKGYKMTLKRK
jgi:hypothetical protein